MNIGRPRIFVWLQGFLGTLLILIVGLEFIVYSPPGRQIGRSLSVSPEVVESDTTSTTIDIRISHSRSDTSVDLVAFPLLRPTAQRSIYVYDDVAYPTASVNPTASQDVFYHLAGELRIRDYSKSIELVNASALNTLLKETDKASTRLLVFMTGVIPADAFSRQADLVNPWVRAGGILIWGGATIGYYSGLAGRTLAQSHQLSYADAGPPMLLGTGLVTPPWMYLRTADTPSEFASALAVNFRLVSEGINRDVALARGGLLLGWYAGRLSSVTYLPRGQGGYLIFAGEILDEVSVSLDIARLILAGAIYGSGPVSGRAIQLDPGSDGSVVRWELPFPKPTAGILFVAFDPNPDAAFFYRRILGS